MPPLYLVGYDASRASRAAMGWTCRLAERTGADVLAVNVYDAAPHTGVHGFAIPGADLVEADVRQAAQRCMDDIGEPGTRREVHAASSAAQGLHELAETQHASLLVVGRTHRGAVGRHMRGSVARRLLHGAPCPVIVVPENGPPDLRVLGVAYDASPESENALEFAAELARDVAAKLLLVGVLQPGPYRHPETSPELWRSLWLHTSESLEDAAARVRATGLDVSSRMRDGDIADELLAVCAEDADLLVAGSRGFGPVRAAIAGSTSSKLADAARCPVVIVPRGVVPVSEADVVGHEVGAAS
jgi:nucleotide-binding universal stress UspA family protein